LPSLTSWSTGAIDRSTNPTETEIGNAATKRNNNGTRSWPSGSVGGRRDTRQASVKHAMVWRNHRICIGNRDIPNRTPTLSSRGNECHLRLADMPTFSVVFRRQNNHVPIRDCFAVRSQNPSSHASAVIARGVSTGFHGLGTASNLKTRESRGNYSYELNRTICMKSQYNHD
jgi:hypothetical protein